MLAFSHILYLLARHYPAASPFRASTIDSRFSMVLIVAGAWPPVGYSYSRSACILANTRLITFFASDHKAPSCLKSTRTVAG